MLHLYVCGLVLLVPPDDRDALDRHWKCDARPYLLSVCVHYVLRSNGLHHHKHEHYRLAKSKAGRQDLS